MWQGGGEAGDGGEHGAHPEPARAVAEVAVVAKEDGEQHLGDVVAGEDDACVCVNSKQ